MAVEESGGQCGKCRTNRVRQERKGTPQCAPISPLLSNVYMRRLIFGWKVLSHAWRFGAVIANYADVFVVCGRAPAEAMRAAVEGKMEWLRLPVNARKTRCVPVPEEPVEFLVYRVGHSYRPKPGEACLGTRPSAGSLRSISKSPQQARYGLLDECVIVARLNRTMLGWASTPTSAESVRPTERSTRTRRSACASACSRRTRYPPGSTCATWKSTHGML